MYYETCCVFYILSPEARGYKTHNSFQNTSYGVKIHLRSYMYGWIAKFFLKSLKHEKCYINSVWINSDCQISMTYTGSRHLIYM